MNYIQAILLGTIQGFTEFLPVSSSGHLTIIESILHIQDNFIEFNIVVHLGSLFALLYFFSNRIKKLTYEESKKIILISLPTLVIGLFVRLNQELFFIFNLLVGINLIITGFLNIISNKLIKQNNKSKNQNYNLSNNISLEIGILSSFAILPGISRSGITLFNCLKHKIDTKQSFNYALLTGIPIILAASLSYFPKIITNSGMNISFLNLLIGFCSAFITGLISLKILQKIIIDAKLHIFGLYCIVLGLFYKFSIISATISSCSLH